MGAASKCPLGITKPVGQWAASSSLSLSQTYGSYVAGKQLKHQVRIQRWLQRKHVFTVAIRELRIAVVVGMTHGIVDWIPPKQE